MAAAGPPRLLRLPFLPCAALPVRAAQRSRRGPARSSRPPAPSAWSPRCAPSPALGPSSAVPAGGRRRFEGRRGKAQRRGVRRAAGQPGSGVLAGQPGSGVLAGRKRGARGSRWRRGRREALVRAGGGRAGLGRREASGRATPGREKRRLPQLGVSGPPLQGPRGVEAAAVRPRHPRGGGGNRAVQPWPPCPPPLPPHSWLPRDVAIFWRFLLPWGAAGNGQRGPGARLLRRRTLAGRGAVVARGAARRRTTHPCPSLW